MYSLSEGSSLVEWSSRSTGPHVRRCGTVHETQNTRRRVKPMPYCVYALLEYVSVKPRPLAWPLTQNILGGRKCCARHRTFGLTSLKSVIEAIPSSWTATWAISVGENSLGSCTGSAVFGRDANGAPFIGPVEVDETYVAARFVQAQEHEQTAILLAQGAGRNRARAGRRLAAGIGDHDRASNQVLAKRPSTPPVLRR